MQQADRNRRTSPARPAIGLVAAILIAGCQAPPPYGQSDAEAVVLSVEAAWLPVAVLSTALEESLALIPEAERAASAVQLLDADLRPSSCVKATAAADCGGLCPVSVELEHCAGPRGIDDVTGAMSIEFGGFFGYAGLTGVMLRGAQVESGASQYSLTGAAWPGDGGSGSVEVLSQALGTGPDGEKVSASINGSLERTGDCVRASGQFNLKASIHWQRCAAGCPTGEVTFENNQLDQLRVTATGTKTATWATRSLHDDDFTPRGTVELHCE